MPDNNSDNEIQNSTSSGFKARRSKASMFFKKAMRQDESIKDETIERLQEEKRKLRQELNKAYSRIRELELLTTRPNEQSMALSANQTAVSSEAELLYASEGVENRDDDSGHEDIDDEIDGFSVEVAAITRGSTIQGEFLDIENEIYSTAPSAQTVPTGNDKNSNFQRREHQLRQRLRRGDSSTSSKSSGSNSRRGEDAFLDYFSRRNSPPLESITEIETRTCLSYDDDDDMASTTSELTASVASSAMLADERFFGGGSLMSGKRIPLSAMKSLMRISSAESSEAESASGLFVQDGEQVLFGEI